MKISLLLFALVVASIFNATASPSVSGFAPAWGPVGTSVVITGTGFNPVMAQNVVFFGATQATVVAASATSLTVTVPLGTTNHYITVTDIASGLTASSLQPFAVTFNGSTNFAIKIDKTTGTQPTTVAVADLDGDGQPDICIATVGAGISVYRNISLAGTLTFAPRVDFTAGVTTSSLALDDMNGDGKKDMISIDANSDEISIFKNTSIAGTLSFDTAILFNGGPTCVSLAIADLNGDGKPDMVTTNIMDNQLSILINVSTGGGFNFTTTTLAAANGPNAVAIGDLDNDTKPDLAVTNITDNTVSVFINTSTLSSVLFATNVDFTTGNDPRHVAIGDLDNDGLADIATANGTSNKVSALLNTTLTPGNPAFALPVDFTTGNRPVAVTLNDLDGDGKKDLITANFTPNTVSILKNTSVSGTISFAAKVDLACGTRTSWVASADFDMDSLPDIVASNNVANSISLFRQTVPTGGRLATNGSFCGSGIAQLTYNDPTATGPFTLIYSYGTTIDTANSVSSGVAFASFLLDTTTTFRLIAARDAGNNIRIALDSVKTVVVYETTLYQTLTLCQGEMYQAGAHTYTQSGSYRDTLTAAASHGCDSFIITQLTVLPQVASQNTVSLCYGEVYSVWIHLHTVSGVYIDTLTGLSVNGCDSIVSTNLTIAERDTLAQNLELCPGQIYEIGGHTYNSNGVYHDTLLAVNPNGCNVYVTSHITLLPAVATTVSDSICPGYTYDWHGLLLTTAGTYLDTLSTTQGCDSAITLHLQMANLPTPAITRTGDTLMTTDYATYQWLVNDEAIIDANNQQLPILDNGSFRVLVTDSKGCTDTSLAFNVLGLSVRGYSFNNGYIQLYPNPNYGKFTLKFADDKERRVQIKDAIGRVITEQNKVKTLQQFNLEGQAPGLFFVSIWTDNEQQTVKFIKQ